MEDGAIFFFVAGCITGLLVPVFLDVISRWMERG